MSFAYFTPKGCRFKGIPLTFSSLEAQTHEVVCGLGASIGPRHERIISPAKFSGVFERRALVSALPAIARRAVQFGGGLVAFEEAHGFWGAVPVSVESSDGIRALLLDSVPLERLEGMVVDELVITRVAPASKTALALQSVVDQLICRRETRTDGKPSSFRVAVKRLDIAWALFEGLKARDADVQWSGSWSQMGRARSARSEPDFRLCPVDGHLKRLKVGAFISSVTQPLSVDVTGGHPHYVIRDAGTVKQLRQTLASIGNPRVIGPNHLLKELEEAGLAISTTSTQASFGW